ncbi:hypothetical protein ACFOKI_08190 [Sphingomonas qilianensis]|uniref:Uncharacterized protein n=1 Tax=Sphingomonas qilianensis TaxID=1736690 RepID=A0ABU9XT57_9SPHN
MIARQRRRGAVFGIPLLLALVTLAGLVIGLLGDGGYDIAAGLAMLLPVAVIAWSLGKARRG